MTSRSATTHWTGDLKTGSGELSLESSNLGSFDVSFPTRMGQPEGQTSPEELIASALSSCLAMNISGVLAAEDLIAESINVAAEATLNPDGDGGFEISIEVIIRVKLSGVDEERFAELAATAERTCPVNKALAGTKITFDAKLV